MDRVPDDIGGESDEIRSVYDVVKAINARWREDEAVSVRRWRPEMVARR